MPLEIERKFLVRNNHWRALVTKSVHFCQGYLCRDEEKTIRVRVAGNQAFITLKAQSNAPGREEFEYPIPPEDAHYMLKHFCGKLIVEKIRHYVPWEEFIWEIDEFQGQNAGLVLAEVELSNWSQVVPLPEWIGEEVTHQERYYNVNLAYHPYGKWQELT
ncbi:MAG: CYTH domain-containing protein [Cytophagales bacterium]|nr:CYTH domain-containing protein [Bernardetiaceae bacterium]MDW8210346.1 CYTH domain-containing protein [Cytophagales bacterium]